MVSLCKHKKIKLSQGLFAVVDEQDYQQLNQYNWSATRMGTKDNFYAVRSIRENGRKHSVLMHRLILGFPPSEVDHRDGNGLNNCRRNIRPATSRQNKQNRKKSLGLSSKFKGVAFDKSRTLWIATIRINGTQVNLGRYKTQRKAALSYNRAAKEAFKEFAALNRIYY